MTKNDAKMDPQKVMGPKGPWAQIAGRGKESLLDATSSQKQTSSKQLKSNTLEPLARPNTHLTCQQARCGSINILGPRPRRAPCTSDPQGGPSLTLPTRTGGGDYEKVIS